MDATAMPRAMRLTLCFRTKLQAKALVKFARALHSAPPERIDLVYCRRPGAGPADSLAPWLDDIVAEIEAHLGVRGSVRTAGISVEGLVADLALDRDQMLLVASDAGSREATRWALRLLAGSPVQAALVNGDLPEPIESVLVGVDGGSTAGAASALASAIAESTDADVVAVSAHAAHRRALAAVRELDQRALAAVRQIDHVGSMARSLLDAGTYRGMVQGRSRDALLLAAAKKQEPDVVVAGLQRGALLGETGSPRVPQALLRRCPATVVLVNVPARPALQRVTACMARLSDVLPTIPAAQRATIYSQVRRSARGDTDFLFMIVASTSLAALGLRLDSAVVIIGAMLVAPLMSPIVAVGMAVAQGDGKLLAMAIRSVLRGIGVAIAASFVLGLVLPTGEVTSEMLKRTNPTLLDLAVAIASGCAGAYALSRKGVSSSLPGVAIAVSLVPPLATVGMGLAMREPDVASGAMLLFLVNLAAVAATASLMFVWMGFSPEIGHIGRSRTFGRGVAGLGAMLVAVTLPLMWAAVQLGEDGASTEQIEAAVQASAGEAGARVVGLEIETAQAGLAVSVAVEVAQPLGEQDLEEFHDRVERAAGEQVRLTVRSEIVAEVGGTR